MHTTLCVHHNLYLSREDRYRLYKDEPVVVTGVCVPVWFQKNFSTEPAVEVFARYQILPGEPGLSVKQGPGGFSITLPHPPPPAKKPPENVWKALSEVDRDAWFEKNNPGPNTECLLDVRDGGCAFLAFRQFNNVERNKKQLRLIHFVEIKDIEVLNRSLS